MTSPTVTVTFDLGTPDGRQMMLALVAVLEGNSSPAEVQPVPPADADACPRSVGSLAGGFVPPAPSSSSTDAPEARAQQPVCFASIAPRVGSGAFFHGDTESVAALTSQVEATSIEVGPPAAAAGESPATIPSERDAMMPEPRTDGEGGASLVDPSAGWKVEAAVRAGTSPEVDVAKTDAAAGESPAPTSRKNRAPRRPQPQADTSADWPILVARVLAGESCKDVAREAGVKGVRLNAYVGAAKARARREAALLDADGWNPQRDLVMAEAILCGHGVDRAAEKLHMQRDLVLERWNKLLPVKGLSEQAALMTRLRERAEVTAQ